MQKRIDNLGRIVIPAEYRNAIGVNDNGDINIELVEDKIIITNPKNDERIKRIKDKLEDVQETYKKTIIIKDRDFLKGYADALEWLLEDLERVS